MSAKKCINDRIEPTLDVPSIPAYTPDGPNAERWCAAALFFSGETDFTEKYL